MSLEGAVFKSIKKGLCGSRSFFMPWLNPSQEPSLLCFAGGRPELAGLGEMLALLQQLLPDVARHQGAAVLINPMPKVLASHTNA